MKKGFEGFVEGYNEMQLGEFKKAYQALGKTIFLYYQAMLEAGFDIHSALELTKAYQTYSLNLAFLGKKNKDAEEE